MPRTDTELSWQCQALLGRVRACPEADLQNAVIMLSQERGRNELRKLLRPPSLPTSIGGAVSRLLFRIPILPNRICRLTRLYSDETTILSKDGMRSP